MNFGQWPRQKKKANIGYILPLHPNWTGLDPIMLKIIQMRCGLGQYKRKYSLTEITKLLGFKHYETVRQLEIKALKRLRDKDVDANDAGKQSRN